jgi:N4-(beta-N-acetylglucosaminyl)-L-asparaginase
VGGAGSTGRGEENIRVAGAHTIVENMRHGMTAKEACLDALRRVVRNFDGDRGRLQQFDLSYYALRKDGDYAGASLWNMVEQRGTLVRRKFAVTDGAGGRLEECAYLFERKMS